MDPTTAPLAPLCRMVLLLRLVACTVTIFELVGEQERAPQTIVELAIAVLLSYVPLRLWERVGPLVARRPVLLAIDLGISLALFALLGPTSPFFLYTLGTALLAGLLYREAGAAFFSIALLVAYYAVVASGDEGATQVHTLVTLPILYPLAAAAGAAVRKLLDHQAATEASLRRAERATAAEHERARVAREMHDSLGKTLYGIALSARALAKRIGEQAPDAARAARDLSGAAQLAAEEARGLISDLRADRLALPLGAALVDHVERWSSASGVAASARGEEVDLPNPGTRYELFCIVKEALRNVERHARASNVEVALTQVGDRVVLSIADDGVGIDGRGDPRALESDGHYGLVGIAERAERVGATVTLEGARGRGTRVLVEVPAGDARAAEPWAVEEVPT